MFKEQINYIHKPAKCLTKIRGGEKEEKQRVRDTP